MSNRVCQILSTGHCHRLHAGVGASLRGDLIEIQFYSCNHPQLVLFTDCEMNSTMKEKTESVMNFKTKELKNCTKSMAAELHTQTV